MPLLDSPSPPLARIRAAIGPALGHTGPIPVYRIAALVNVSPMAWTRAEADWRTCNGETLERIVRGLRRMGVPVTYDYLCGLRAELPECDWDKLEASSARLPVVPDVAKHG